MLANARRRLLDARVPAGHWEGKLSSSALSTATAAFALHLFGRSGDAGRRAGECARLSAAGVAWLVANQNADGGWGDTTLSLSNISTTALCWAALRAIPCLSPGAVERAEAWLTQFAGSLDPSDLSRAISLRYGADRTFSVPILTMCAAAGVLGVGGDRWRHVPQLPFELAAMPRSWFAFLRLPVVSYALPALIAIGQARHRCRPSLNPVARFVRRLALGRTLRVLEQIQPAGGGFLEATPLTSFVVLSLVAGGAGAHPVVERGAEFIIRSVRADGSWPIDTNLATWVSTLSVNALAAGGRLEEHIPPAECDAIREWLLAQQYREVHPYTGSPPGGWAWTDLPGGVPDADDTAGALIALRNLGREITPPVDDAVRSGVRWLLGIQNRDGGIPTFCRGWGKLPFDRSTPELTAHVLRAWAVWRECLPLQLREAVDRAAHRALGYVRRSQQRDGSWNPLWFGNQAVPNDVNPTYGTARVLIGLADAAAARQWGDKAGLQEMLRHGVQWLLAAQHQNGGWGGARGITSSIEETCQAVYALSVACSESSNGFPGRVWTKAEGEMIRVANLHALRWLAQTTDNGRVSHPIPIGLYFAKLWYWEELYPLLGLASLSPVPPRGGHARRRAAPQDDNTAGIVQRK